MKLILENEDEIAQYGSYLEKMRSAAGENSDASESITTIPHVEQDAQEVHEDEHEDDKISGEHSGLYEILDKHGIGFNPDNTSWNILGCKSTAEEIYSILGYEKTDFLFDVNIAAWSKGTEHCIQRFDGAILKELAAFILLYWDYGIDKDKLIRHLSKAVTSDKPITTDEFKNKITVKQGEETLNLYNAGAKEENRFPNITRRSKVIMRRRKKSNVNN